MENKVFTVTVYNEETVRILFSYKIGSYYVELSDVRRLLELNLKELPERHQPNFYYFDTNIDGRKKKFTGIASDDLEVLCNFSNSKHSNDYTLSILSIINQLKSSYSGYTKGLVLDQENQDLLISELERKYQEVNILEGQNKTLQMSAKLFHEFTDNTTLIPLRYIVPHLKYKTTYPQLLGHLRQSGALIDDDNISPFLIENGAFRVFIWSSRIGDQSKTKSIIVVSNRGIKYINEILEKASGKERK